MRSGFLLVLVPAVLACGGPPKAGAELSASTPAKESPTPAPPAPVVVAEKRARPTAVDDVAREIVARFNARDPDGVVALFGPSMREAFPVEKQLPFIDGLLAEKGRLGALEREGQGEVQHAVYVLRAERGEWRLVLDVDREGRVLGMSVRQPPPPDPPVVKSAIPIGLPFKGEWLVFWGGDTLAANQHVLHASQRRAADLCKVDAAGKTHKGDGKKNEDYYAYGQEALAAADGVVTLLVDGLPDNEPGSMNRYMAFGNALTIKHADNLFSFYAHLAPGKHRVKLGSKVKRGDVLGIVGNSGNTSEPHLHFQLQDGPRFEASWGVEPIFANVSLMRGGATSKAAEYTFLKGDKIAP